MIDPQNMNDIENKVEEHNNEPTVKTLTFNNVNLKKI